MNRRDFLKLAGLTAVTAVVAPQMLIHSHSEASMSTSKQEWAMRWYRWASQTTLNIQADDDGVNIQKANTQPELFFVSGGPYEDVLPITRHFTVPESKVIVFSILNAIYDLNDVPQYGNLVYRMTDGIRNVVQHSLPAETIIRDMAKTDIDYTKEVIVKLDGKLIQSERISSSMFSIDYVKNNVIEPTKVGKTQAVCDGYWLFLNLSKGEHKLYVKAEGTTGVPPSESGEAYLQESINYIKTI